MKGKEKAEGDHRLLLRGKDQRRRKAEAKERLIMQKRAEAEDTRKGKGGGKG